MSKPIAQIGLKIQEYNEVGVEVATYVANSSTPTTSATDTHEKSSQTLIHRVDIVPPFKPATTASSAHTTKSINQAPNTYLTTLLSVFLPSGFPHTVTPDYIPYQIYDSLQAFSSSIAGLLASRAVLEGLGVGSSSSASSPPPDISSTSVVLLSILQESASRFATILFAWRLGTTLEPEAKYWRLAADVFNDLGMVLDCLSPWISRGGGKWGWWCRMGVLSGASVLRALCGVAAGSSKASLSRHFVVEGRGGSVGELNAKDSSQETVISLLGMWAGSLVLSLVTTPLTTWLTLLILLTIHIGTNYLAVRSVCMRTLNRQRSNIVFSHLYSSDRDEVLTPTDVAGRERVFEWDGVLRWNAEEVVGWGSIGGTMEELCGCLGGDRMAGSFKGMNVSLQGLIEAFKGERYLLWFDIRSRRAVIVLTQGAGVEDQLRGWSLALVVARDVATVQKIGVTVGGEEVLEFIRKTLVRQREVFPTFMQRLKDGGWDVETGVLETRPGRRIEIGDS